ncbi:uncharacterized protein LOC106878818 [Octopus bimaculoides]|uniref:uncharacterized protein LOC106878818 n=1 Tax=Octopus bimaculoides TaxID=37653 RepID=UPI00071C744D|nr:uncharacterized protein LOC106878818 [Octopus bimaculoides]|eukprot:XP_014783645.1 PREDICTED: uncharacterized protein LOC106878818 [Octopus bimaculoides]
MVGPWPVSCGFTYILTCIDRFSRWPEAIPLVDISVESVARALISGWISCFGVTSRITTDHGRQFGACLFRELSRLLGVQHIHIISYHPAVNGMVERFHRQLKAGIRTAPDPHHWSEFLSIVLLGCRSAVKEDLDYFTELLFSATLALPGQMLAPVDLLNADHTSYVTRLTLFFADLPPMLPRDQSISSTVPPNISTWTHVFVRNEAVKGPLTPPYTGPYRVLKSTLKQFTVDIYGKKETVSIDSKKSLFRNIYATC